MAVHPLRPATYRRLGEPLPHQLANRTQISPLAHIAFIIPWCQGFIISGISCRFQQLSQSKGQVIYALLTRPPPSTAETASSWLACVKHSVSVHPEPGSNSSSKIYFHTLRVFYVVSIFVLLTVELFISLYSFSIVLAPFSRGEYKYTTSLLFCQYYFFIFSPAFFQKTKNSRFFNASRCFYISTIFSNSINFYKKLSCIQSLVMENTLSDTWLEFLFSIQCFLQLL